MSITINRVYTKFGDGGDTALVGGRKVGKETARIEAYGTVDELNAHIGVLRHANRGEPGPAAWIAQVDDLMRQLQNELFSLGSELATLPEDIGPKQPRITDKHSVRWEAVIDEHNARLPALRSFTLPGGGAVSSQFHVARTVCRRAERSVVALARQEAVAPEVLRYVNRLSDALFVLGRANAKERGEAEPLWEIP